MRPRVAVFGGSFNPPCTHHRYIAEALIQLFDRILVIPCGGRKDKRTNDGIDPLFRAAMADLTFGDLPKVEVINFDLEQDTFTTTWELAQKFAHLGDLSFVIGPDLIEGAASGRAEINHWFRAADIWRQLHFTVVDTGRCLLQREDLPPQHQILHSPCAGSSTEVRQLRFNHQPITGRVMPAVESLIERHRLYQGMPPRQTSTLQLADPRLLIITDEHNARAVTEAEHLAAIGRVDEHQPNLILVLGGDGTMLRAIRQHWRKHIPFLGVNYGTVGFLLNDFPQGLTPSHLAQPWEIIHTPLLYVTTTTADGQVQTELGFNDAYVDADPGKAGWIEISVDGQVLIPRLVADGALVATAAGSSAYARAMGATPIAIGTPSLVLAGSNVFLPAGWRNAQLGIEQVIKLRNVDPTPGHNKRPLSGFIDGLPQGHLESMEIRASRVASVELAFLPGHNPRHKLTKVQFPST